MEVWLFHYSEKGENPLRDKSQYRMVDWKMNKRKKNNIVVYAFDLTANEQNMYEGNGERYRDRRWH